MLLMMVVGVSEVKAQTITDGLYYIASKGKNYTYNSNTPTSNYYLCPSENWYYYQSDSPYYLQHTDTPSSNDNGMPFLTTYLCRNGVYDSKEALWVVKESSTSGWYYIIRLVDGKYLTYNRKMENTTKEGRMRVHLETSPSDTDATLWSINWVSRFECYDIVSKKNDSFKYLNVNDGNKPYLVANGKTDGPNNMATGGIIGLWTYGAFVAEGSNNNDQNSRWQPESTLLTEPTISNVSDANTITITEANDLPAGYTIRYTTGDGTQDAPTAAHHRQC